MTLAVVRSLLRVAFTCVVVVTDRELELLVYQSLLLKRYKYKLIVNCSLFSSKKLRQKLSSVYASVVYLFGKHNKWNVNTLP